MNAAEQAAFTAMQEALSYARRMVKSSECDIAFIDAALSAAKAVNEKGTHHMSTHAQPQLKE